MKLLMTEHFLPESTYTLELGKELKNLSELTCFCRKGAAVPMDGIRWLDGFYGGGKNMFHAAASYLAGLCRLAREIRRGGDDIVHVQSFKSAAWEMPLYLRAGRHYRFLVHTVHNLLPHEAVKADRKRYLRFYKACDLLIVHNEHCKRLLEEEYGIRPGKICVVPHGAYTLSESVCERTPSDTVRFLQFGIFRRYKGIDILFRALSLLSEEQKKGLHVTVAGAWFPKLDPVDYEALAESMGLSGVVTVRRGHIPDQELDSLFAETDFCLFPYRHIYGSGALLMAYSYQKPVIASDIPVFVEETQGGKTGILFAGGDPQALKDAILLAAGWTDEAYALCQKRIEELTKGKYSWRNSANALVNAYGALGKKQVSGRRS